MTKNIIDKFIQEHATQIGGIKVFASQDAKEFVRLLIGNERKILGVDGIFVNQEGHRPSMEDSILTQEWYDEGISESKIETQISKFINERADKQDLLFEIVFK